MRRISLSPAAYRRLTLAALVSIAFIIVTGASVRLTGAGLGCSTWPNCEPGSLTPRDASAIEPWIEFVNRLVTGVVSVAVVLAVLGARRRTPYRRDLVWLAWALVAGVVAQIVLGGMVVLLHLEPLAVMGHFLLSIVLLGFALVLHHRAGLPAPDTHLVVTSPVRRATWVVAALTLVVLMTGTVVTAAGPNGGDDAADRLDVPLRSAAQVHGSFVVLLVGALVALLTLFHRVGVPARTRHAGFVFLGTLAVQGAIGYTQYFTGVPPLLVGFHVAGAVVAFTAATELVLSQRGPAPGGIAADHASTAGEPHASLVPR